MRGVQFFSVDDLAVGQGKLKEGTQVLEAVLDLGDGWAFFSTFVHASLTARHRLAFPEHGASTS